MYQIQHRLYLYSLFWLFGLKKISLKVIYLKMSHILQFRDFFFILKQGIDYEPLITWEMINTTFPWSILLLAGGGLALAEGFKKSGLSELIGVTLKNVIPPQRELALLIIVAFSLIGTEVLF
jgi:hypothetical protein